MPDRYVEAIVKYLSSRDYQPLKPRQLARQMGIAEAEYATFRNAVKRLRDAGRIVLGAKNALTLPEIANYVTGKYRPNPRGFGFVIPDTPNSHGDLFIPPGAAGDALSGDTVRARVAKRGKQAGQMRYAGQIVEILQRGTGRFVGTLREAEDAWFVLPDGKEMTTPILIRDIGTAGPKAGAKVVAEIVKYGGDGELPTGVIVETLGAAGKIEVETLSVIRAFGLPDEFSAEALADARRAVDEFDPSDAAGRKDIASQMTITIDPPDARDFDDAISLKTAGDGQVTLGVHIADVSHFVREQTALDDEARTRATSVYFPRKVLPMLPEILSNGVCSLQEGQRRYAKSAFITYDTEANVTDTRFAETVIVSDARLTYEQAQQICDGRVGGYRPEVVDLVRRLRELARAIEARRRAAGMLHLDLPEVELIFDEKTRVADAVPQDDSYTHTMIEMFMVEANDAVAGLLDRQNRAFLRRIHPAPEPTSSKEFAGFVRACGHKLPADLTRADLQQLLAAVKGRPESYAVNLAVLKTFQQAEYSPMQVGHYALASQQYCHFTSPIRRYPDLTVHRLLAEHCRGRLKNRPPEDMSELTRLGEHCTTADRRAENAANELRDVLILQLLAGKIGEGFDGVVTGVTNFGIFVQSPRFLVEGLIRMEDLGDDWWEVNARYGSIRGQRSGRTFRIGDVVPVRIAAVDVARRQLSLMPQRDLTAKKKSGPKPKTKPKTKQPTGSRSKPKKSNTRAKGNKSSSKTRSGRKKR